MRLDPFLEHRLRCSRQHFILGAAAAGSVLAGCSGASLLPSGAQSSAAASVDPLASSSKSTIPVPIPANPTLGGLHFQIPFSPGKGDELSTVYDFNGLVGRAGATGTGTGNGTSLFWKTDFGFVQGEFRSASGSSFHGAFTFVWFDIYTDAARSIQTHDYSPGNGGSPGHATGLFWTVPLVKGSVIHEGNAVTLQISDLALTDAFQLFSTPVVPATFSVTATWRDSGTKVRLSETSLGSTFAFDGVVATVDVQWSATSQVSLADHSAFTFQSTGSAATVFARFGHERNGFFAS